MVLGWGIIGTGAVATNFARCLLQQTGTRPHAVASRQKARAEEFAKVHGCAYVYNDAEKLIADPRVKIVYISSPTRFHLEHGLAAVAAGKHVLCEKPFTGNARDAAELVEACRKAGNFCMEAMWLRFNSVILDMQTKMVRRTVGSPTTLSVSIGYSQPAKTLVDPEGRLGCLPVFGCYGLSLAWYLFGPPAGWCTHIRRNIAGTDTDAAVLLKYSFATVQIETSVVTTRTNRLEVVCSEGSLIIPRDVITPTELIVQGGAQSRFVPMLKQVTEPLRRQLSGARGTASSGGRGQIAEVIRCIAEGKAESPRMPLSETLAIQRLIGDLLASSAAYTE